MIVIGLCGSSGAGKGYTCQRLAEHGISFIDTDKVYTERVVCRGSKCLSELTQYFGDEILAPDGSLNKKALAKIVFEGENAQESLSKLNEITHKHIKRETEKILAEIERNGAVATAVDAPVLFESGFDRMCDVTMCVTAPSELKIKRIMERDGITREKAMSRLASQITDDELRARCDIEIVNDGSGSLDAHIIEAVKKINLNR